MGLLRRPRPDDVDVDSCLANLDRLSALTATGLMDAPAREDLDGLARRAAAQLGTPMAFMSLVDNRRVFFAAAAGVTGELAETRQNPVEASYCQHVVAFDDVLVVDDALSDALVVDNPPRSKAARAPTWVCHCGRTASAWVRFAWSTSSAGSGQTTTSPSFRSWLTRR